MNHQDLRTLRILEEIGRDHGPSQRDLAKKLNVSLGLVNSFVKRLAHKGYFKVRTIPRNRVKYVLTPKGMAEKTRLTYEYIQQSYQFYKGAREKLRQVFQDLVKSEVRGVVFYGATDLAEIAFVSLKETSIELVAVVDGERIGEGFLGRTVTSPDSLESLSYDRILITTVGSRQEALETIRARGVASDVVVMVR